MKRVFKFILPIALVPVFASCGGNDNATHYVTFHQELAEDVKIEFNKNTTDGEIIAQEPELVKKEGYDVKWEDYTVVGKTADFTVNAIYSEYTYTVTFKQKGLIIDTVPFTASDVKGDHPQLPAEKVPTCPSDTWYTYEWEDYELKLCDIVVNAVSTGKVEHIAKFTDIAAEGKVIADNVKFGRNDVNDDGTLKDSVIPDSVKNYHHDASNPTYWDNNWDFRIPAGADINVTFDANVTKHDFEINFLDYKEELIETRFYQFDTIWADMEKPDVSGYEGYDCAWPDTHNFSFDVVTPDSVSPNSTAHKHTLTFEGYGDTQEVTYDSSFTLNHEGDTNNDLKMWYDQDGNQIPTSGDKWKIDKDLTLHLEEVKEVNFDNDYLPRFISTDTGNGNSLKIINNPKGEGKVLEVSIPKKTDTAYLILSNDYMTQAFNTDGINSIEFDAMATKNWGNFRARYKVSRGGAAPAFSNNCYENDYVAGGLGITTDRYKTFSFKKEYFTDQDSGGNIKFIYGNFDVENQKVYIDRIRLSTEKEINFSGFEGGGLRLESTNQFKYSSGGRGGGNDFPHYISRLDYLMVMDENKTGTDTVSLVNDINNGGITSLKIHKAANSPFPLYFWGAGTSEVPSKVSKIQFDIYCTEDFNENSVKDGDNHFVPGFGTFAAKTWHTLVFDNLEKIEGTGESRHGNCSSDGRFAYIAGSSLAADFYIDNVIATLRS